MSRSRFEMHAAVNGCDLSTLNVDASGQRATALRPDGTRVTLTLRGARGVSVSVEEAASAAEPSTVPGDPGTSQGASDLSALAEQLGESNAAASRRAVSHLLAELRAGRAQI